MKYLLFSFSVFINALTYAGVAMNPYDTLLEFESFYAAIHPSQENNSEAFVWVSEVPNPLFNAVIHLSCEDVRHKVDELINQYPNKPLSFWVHTENHATGLVEILQERNFAPIITCPLMAWPIRPVNGSKADIRPAHMEIFYEILWAAYQFDEEVKANFQALMKRVKGEHYVAYEDGKPVATGTLMLNATSGGIFNDATLSGRREASQAMMKFLMHRAYELKLEQLIVLSSPEAAELYGSLGFENLMDIDIYSR